MRLIKNFGFQVSLIVFITLVLLYYQSYKLQLRDIRPNSGEEFLTDKVDAHPQILKKSTVENVNACILILTRNSELLGISRSIVDLEDRFNNKFNYPYVFLNEVPFTEEFKIKVQSLTKSKVEFGLIPKEHWSYPKHINQTIAAEVRERDKDAYGNGGTESYRHMCRFYSGFFYLHELTLKYDYYWRVEPDIRFTCDINEDPFRRMLDSKAMYGFTVANLEDPLTIPTLWSETKEWLKTSDYAKKLPKNSAEQFISTTYGVTYNLCQFWSNFEIGNFNLWRSEAYNDYFKFLDSKTGFFYERWGDAPIHTIYASLALTPKQMIYFDDIGYVHGYIEHCPVNKKVQEKCSCDPVNDFNQSTDSCTVRWEALYL